MRHSLLIWIPSISFDCRYTVNIVFTH